MKILHTSDIHLDSPLTSRLPGDKARIRRRELLSSFGELINKAKELSVEAVIIAGDLFDGENLTKKGLDTALFAIANNPTVNFFYLPGNHEGDALIRSGRALPGNLFIFGEDWTYFKSGDTVVAGRSRIERGMFDSLDLRSEDKNILVLHGEPTDRTEAPEGIGLADAVGKNIDYMALGHYHTSTSYEIDSRGVAVYCGTPEGRGFDECGERGFVVFDTSNPRAFRFIPHGERRCRIITLDVSGITDYGILEESCKRALSEASCKDIVRLELVGKRYAELWIDGDEIESIFKDKFFYFEVKNSSKIFIQKEDYQYDKTLKGEFIRLVNSKEDIDEATKEKVISAGLYALMGE